MARLEDKYELVRKLAAGGMGEVFLAKSLGAGGFEKQVVIKVLHKHLGVKKELFDLFLQEARLVGQMSHPNIVQVFDVGESDGRPWLVMEFVDGANLLNLRRRTEAQGRKVPIGVACRIMSEVCGGLSHAHQLIGKDGQKLGLVHRDLSPDNIMVEISGVSKVTDFGIAKVKDSNITTAPGWTRGKFMYMSPEQISGDGNLTDKADIFVAGMVMYELLTGKHPFFGSDGTFAALKLATAQFNPMTSVRPEIPEDLELLVGRALALKPEDRFQSARIMKQAIEQFLRHQSDATQEDVADFLASTKEDSSRTWVDLGTPNESVDVSIPTVANTPAPHLPKTQAEKPTADGDGHRTLLDTDVAAKLTPMKNAKKWWALAAIFVGLGLAGIFVLVLQQRHTVMSEPELVPLKVTPPIATQLARPLTESIDAGVIEPDQKVELPVIKKPAPLDELVKSSVKNSVPKFGEVTFRIQPWARVYLDGKLLGDTPFDAVKIPLGTHRIRLTNSELGVDRQETLVVKVGKQIFGLKL